MIACRGARQGGRTAGPATVSEGEREVGGRADVADLSGAADVMAARPGGGIRQRQGLRITLLSLAAAILLLGAAVAGTFGYHMLASG
jgi:hypothetical protein